jgi:hypothetical protein
LGHQPRLTAVPIRAFPASHGAAIDAQPLRDDMHGNIPIEQLDGLLSPPFEFGRTPLWAHGIPPTEDNRTLLKQESIVVELLLKMGYGGSRSDAGRAIGRVGDEGIDGVINEDRLGLDVVYLQAKKWDGTVGRPEVQRFVGALHGKRARKGVFIT